MKLYQRLTKRSTITIIPNKRAKHLLYQRLTKRSTITMIIKTISNLLLYQRLTKRSTITPITNACTWKLLYQRLTKRSTITIITEVANCFIDVIYFIADCAFFRHLYSTHHQHSDNVRQFFLLQNSVPVMLQNLVRHLSMIPPLSLFAAALR